MKRILILLLALCLLATVGCGKEDVADQNSAESKNSTVYTESEEKSNSDIDKTTSSEATSSEVIVWDEPFATKSGDPELWEFMQTASPDDTEEIIMDVECPSFAEQAEQILREEDPNGETDTLRYFEIYRSLCEDYLSDFMSTHIPGNRHPRIDIHYEMVCIIVDATKAEIEHYLQLTEVDYLCKNGNLAFPG